MSKVLHEVEAERARQDEKWGEQNCHDFEWVSILAEEVGEAAAEANEANFHFGKNRGDFTKLRAELVQVAAVAVAWIEAIDRRSPESTVSAAAESDLRDDEFFVRHGESFHVDLGAGECAVWREIDGGFGVSVEVRNDKVIERRIYRNGTQSVLVRGY
jgi:NTP pyrophosphatase (non-canonical NTP hydrolase)